MNATYPQTAPQRKLTPNLRDKVRYVVHYCNLKLYLQLGLVVTQIHKVLMFKQSTWLKTYIYFNIHQRSLARSSFLKEFFKLMNNSVFGKTQDNLRKRVLDLSKQHIYNFHYNHMYEKYPHPNQLQLLFTDTDSLAYAVQTEGIYRDQTPAILLLELYEKTPVILLLEIYEKTPAILLENIRTDSSHITRNIYKQTTAILLEIYTNRLAPAILLEIYTNRLAPAILLEIYTNRLAPAILLEIYTNRLQPHYSKYRRSDSLQPYYSKYIRSDSLQPYYSKYIRSDSLQPYYSKYIQTDSLQPYYSKYIRTGSIQPYYSK